MKLKTRGMSHVLRRSIALAATALVLLPGANAAEPVEASAERFPEVGRIALPQVPDAFRTGWLIVNPTSRRGYTLSETSNSTTIQSFDLDTLQPRQRITVTGVPIPSGGENLLSGEVLHAIDPVAKRIYLPVGRGDVYNLAHPDARRPVTAVLVLDEARFDADPSHAFGSFGLPASQQRLVNYPLLGMTVTREHVAATEPGRVLAVFASVNPVAAAGSTSSRNLFDHTLVQWDVAGVATDQPPPVLLLQPSGIGPQPLPLVGVATWEHVLVLCGTSTLTSPGADGTNPANAKPYQWDMLATREHIYLGCQSAPMSGAVLRLALDPAGGAPAIGAPGTNEHIVSLGKPLGAVMADPKSKRLYLRSFGGGGTWWAFDIRGMRFAGSIAGTHVDGASMAAGLDPSTGRLYTLTADACIPRQGGGSTPARGGLQIAEAGLDPVPAPENVRPDLAHNAHHRIRVDEVTRRVYVRLGSGADAYHYRYPNCVQDQRDERGVEPFFRVFEDRTPIAEQPPEFDPSLFTTNVPEKDGVTKASYFGSGSGYGARVLLTGGAAAVTNGASDLGNSSASPCSREDRELVAGSVARVEVSEQATAADAAGLDADARTQEAMGDPITRCRREIREVAAPQVDEFNAKCYGDTQSSDEFAFDDKVSDPDPAKRDANGDGCTDRTKVNRYATQCLGDAKPPTATGPRGRSVSRDGFQAAVHCQERDEQAKGFAQGALASEAVDKAMEGAVVQGGLRVGRSTSEVSVKREIGEGVQVKVDSVARGIEIPGVGSIGVVRAEATSRAAGRPGQVGGTFKRTICDVRIGNERFTGCIPQDQQGAIVKRMNDALGGRGEVRLRSPDSSLIEGDKYGYLSGVQRDRKELFGDQSLTRDRSSAVPALEVILYQGEGGQWGAGRQVLQLGGAQASTSYGITCLYGLTDSGKCLTGTATEGPDPVPDPDDRDGDGITIEGGPGDPGPARSGGGGNGIVEFFKRLPQAIAEAAQLLFNNPRELLLLATVWGLLYAPCYVGERRRSVRALAARRVAGGN